MATAARTMTFAGPPRRLKNNPTEIVVSSHRIDSPQMPSPPSGPKICSTGSSPITTNTPMITIDTTETTTEALAGDPSLGCTSPSRFGSTLSRPSTNVYREQML